MCLSCELRRVPLAAVLIAVGSLLLAIAAGMVWAPAGVGVAGGLALFFGIDASRDEIVPQAREREAAGRLRAVGDS